MNSTTSSPAPSASSAVIPFPAAVGSTGTANVGPDSQSFVPVSDYVRVDLVQGSREWHLWRLGGIGGSDAATILGQNPYHSAVALRAERLGRCFPRPQNAAMLRGIELEPAARAWYCGSAGTIVTPVCVQSTRLPWLRASLDGMSADGSRIVEIKCGPAAYFHTRRNLRPPEYYNAQLQHVLAITGAGTIDFVCHLPPYPTIAITVERDDVFIGRLLEAEERFWNALQEPAAA